jgi:hypothetical protein
MSDVPILAAGSGAPNGLAAIGINGPRDTGRLSGSKG